MKMIKYGYKLCIDLIFLDENAVLDSIDTVTNFLALIFSIPLQKHMDSLLKVFG